MTYPMVEGRSVHGVGGELGGRGGGGGGRHAGGRELLSALKALRYLERSLINWDIVCAFIYIYIVKGTICVNC